MGYMVEEYGTHRHPQRKMDKINVFIFVIEGRIQVIDDDVEYQLNAGSYLFLRKNVFHFGEEPYPPGTKWYYIHFYDAPTNNSEEELPEYKYFPQSSMIFEDTYETKLDLPKHGYVRNPDYMVIKLRNLVELYENRHPLRPVQLSLQTYQLFLELFTSQKEESKKTKKHYIVNQMIELLRNSPTVKLSGEEIADSLGMNYAYLSTLFRQHTGKSVTRFQNELLIEKALDLFKQNKGNVSEISNELGFSNPFYFSRVFKKITGVSPTTYLHENY